MASRTLELRAHTLALGNPKFLIVKNVAIGYLNKPKDFLLAYCSLKVSDCTSKLAVNVRVVIVVSTSSTTTLIRNFRNLFKLPFF